MIATNTISLRVKLLAAIATAQSPITGHYVGMTVAGIVSTVQAIHINTNGTTAVAIVPNATAGNVNILKNLQVSNADTAAITVILEQWDGSTAKVMSQTLLAVGQSMTIDSDGRLTINNSSIIGTGTVTQVQGNGTVNGITLTGNITTSGNLTLEGNLTGTAPALTAGNVTNIPNLSGAITGNSTGTTTLTANGFSSADLFNALTNKTGTGLAVFGTNATITTPNLTTPNFCNLSNAIGLNLTTGVSGILPVANGGADQSAWVSFTPSWTNFTIGNGSQSAKYNYDPIRKIVFVRVFVTLGSTSSMGTTPLLTLPITSAATSSAQFEISLAGRIKGSASRFELAAWWTSTTTSQLLSVLSGVPTGITATSPTVWATGDTISLTMMYEAA